MPSASSPATSLSHGPAHNPPKARLLPEPPPAPAPGARTGGRGRSSRARAAARRGPAPARRAALGHDGEDGERDHDARARRPEHEAVPARHMQGQRRRQRGGEAAEPARRHDPAVEHRPLRARKPQHHRLEAGHQRRRRADPHQSAADDQHADIVARARTSPRPPPRTASACPAPGAARTGPGTGRAAAWNTAEVKK